MKETPFFRVIGFIVLVVFSGCSTAPAVNIVPVQATRALLQHMQQTTTRSQTGRTQAQPQQATTVQSASPYWTGDGGRGRSILINTPSASGLMAELDYLPAYIQREFIDIFSNYSAIAVTDRTRIDELIAEYYSGNYSDDAVFDLIRLGHLPITDYFMGGSITRLATGGYSLQVSITRVADQGTEASYSGTSIPFADLDNLTAVRQASVSLLERMGVRPTERTRTELTRAAPNVEGQTALAMGVTAQRQGTEVAALTYFFQAAAFDASLVEAVSRSNILSTNISTGNIGANVRNDIAWRSDWMVKLTETETLMNNMLRSTSPQRSIWYTTNIVEREAARDYTRETTELSIEAALHTHAVFPVSVQRTVQAVYDGLQTTGRRHGGLTTGLGLE